MAGLALGALVALAHPAAAQVAVQEANRRCLNCHGQPHIAELAPQDRRTMVAPPPEGLGAGEAEPAARPDLYLPYEAVYGASVHREVACVSCHEDCAALPHPARAAPARCAGCHPRQDLEYAESVHGRSAAAGSERAAGCADCHGTHDILSSHNRQSRAHKLQLPFTCAACHANPGLMKAGEPADVPTIEQYVDSVHGRALLGQGLIVAPSCNDCHGVHDIRPSQDPASRIHRGSVPQTCGQCHVRVAEIYRESIHGQVLAAGDERAPVCSDCHTAHQIVQPSETAFKLASDDRCGSCHADRLERYRETFHGKAMALGLPNVAACYDCHGHHDILPSSQPRSRLAAGNRVDTCRQCHPGANGNFAGFLAHADHTDPRNYPLLFWTFWAMTALIVGTFAFFGAHTVLWFLWGIRGRGQRPAAAPAAAAEPARGAGTQETFVKFRPFDRFLHMLVIVSFLLLVATGMPLKFYYTGWAQAMVSFMGGLQVAGLLHRLGAIVTFLYFGLHLASLARAAVRNRARFRSPRSGRFSLRQFFRVALGPDLPFFTPRDLADWWAHMKYFLGRGPQPQFDKWSYWEKFDYFAVFWGVAIIGASGLVMWFPVALTRVLPGWVINVALIVHSDEALLAAGFIFTFHFFNTHLRPGKFPMDMVIFSGRVGRAEVLHERRRWYERLAAEGRLEEVRPRDDWPQWKRVVHPLGCLAVVIGLMLLGLIIYAMGSHLLGP